MKTAKIVLLVFVFALLFSGCQQNARLTNLAITQAVAVDLENGKTKVTVQYLNITKNSGTSEALSGTITDTAYGVGDSITDAVSDASRSVSREIFFGQNKVVIFGKEYAKTKLNEGLDYLLRSPNSRPDVLVALSEDTAESIVNNGERGAKVPAQSVYKLINTGMKNGTAACVTVNDMLNAFSDDSCDIILPVLKSKKEYVSCTGIAVFSRGVYALTLDREKAFGLLLLKNDITAGALSVTDSQLGKTGLEIVLASANQNVKKRDSSIEFSCNIMLKLRINEIENGIDRKPDGEALKRLETLVENSVRDIVYLAVTECFNSKSDPFMTLRYLSENGSNLYFQNKSGWRDNLQNIALSVNVNADITTE